MSARIRLARSIADLVRPVPRGLTEPLALIVGGLLMLGYGRRTALENLAAAFPQWPAARRLRVAFGAYRQMARALIEFLHTRQYTDAEILARVEIENPEALASAHAAGEGVVLVSGHYGNWEWLGRRIVAGGYPFAALHKEPKDPGLADRLRVTRAAGGIVQIDYDDMRGALRWVREGGVLGILMDQEPRRSRDGALAPLFGRPTMTHVGPFRLARRTGAPIFTIFCRRRDDGRYLGLLEPFPLSDSSDPAVAAVADAAAFNARLEAAVRRAPDHWLWMYSRWKRLTRRDQRGASAASAPRQRSS